MVSRWLVLVLLCCGCAAEPASSLPPLVPEATQLPSSAVPGPSTRRFETKTIGGDWYPGSRAPSKASPGSSPSVVAPEHNPWSPAHVYGNPNPSPPAPSTPRFGQLNPNPPGPDTPLFGHVNPSPPGPGTPLFGHVNPSPESR